MSTDVPTDAPPGPGPDRDGLHRPGDEAAVSALIREAAARGRRLRVRGAGHAPPDSVATDGDVVLALDALRGIRVLDPGQRLVEVGAGIHLGADPPAGEATGSLEWSLLYRLAHEHGWTLSSTGGITHQTLGGFLATGSAGGTLQHSFLDHVVAVRLLDGHGDPREFEGEELDAVLPNLGLLGVVTAVTLRCAALFAIAGQEAIVDVEHAELDVFGPDGGPRPSLAEFLRGAEYARIEWWPQRGAERLLVWQAQAIEPQPGFRATRYEEFTRYPALAETLIATLYVIFGNLAQPARARELLRLDADELASILGQLRAQGRLDRRARRWVWCLPQLLRGIAALTPALSFVRGPLQALLPRIVPAALGRVLTLDRHKPGMGRGEPQSFRDWGWSGLPMDNQANDTLISTRFSELWVPLRRSQEVVGLLRDYFAAPRGAREAYARTGLFAYELYGAPAATGWLHPGHSDGEDEWREGSLRVDVYWFAGNAEDPRERFFPQFWELLRDHDIPFRLHWGKETPDDPAWAELFASRYPRWEAFLARRAELDPDEVFLTDYWRARLGLR